MTNVLPMDQRVSQFQQYYNFTNERPLLGFYIDSEYPLFRYPAAQILPENRLLEPDDFIVANYLPDYDRLFDRHEACGGDFIFSASAFWGIPWLEAALGCPIYANQQTGSIAAHSPKDFTGSKRIHTFDPQSPWMRKVVEFMDALAAHSRGRWPLAATRMRGIADLLSTLYGHDRFLFAMMDNPDEIDAVCEKLTNFWIAFARLQLEHIPLFHGGIGSFYYHMWVPPDTVWLQEDAAALLSPDWYEQFIRPCDLRIAKAFRGCLMHQHPTKYVPTEYYLDMPFLALELHVDEGGPDLAALRETHRKILERKPLLIWGRLSESDIENVFTHLPLRGLAVMTVVDRPEQAEKIWNKCME